MTKGRLFAVSLPYRIADECVYVLIQRLSLGSPLPHPPAVDHRLRLPSVHHQCGRVDCVAGPSASRASTCLNLSRACAGVPVVCMRAVRGLTAADASRCVEQCTRQRSRRTATTGKHTEPANTTGQQTQVRQTNHEKGSTHMAVIVARSDVLNGTALPFETS